MMRDVMAVLPYSPDFIPLKRRGAEKLLESVDYDLDLLTEDQISAVRRLYFLDSDLTVMEQIQASCIACSPGTCTFNKKVG
jgi:hypothetical protein